MAPTTPQRWRWLFGGTLNMVSAASNVAAGKICGKDLAFAPQALTVAGWTGTVCFNIHFSILLHSFVYKLMLTTKDVISMCQYDMDWCIILRQFLMSRVYDIKKKELFYVP
uniref:Uncharacterized protein n=1 Tax=Anopheles darlingi TaxID=43151 RepID=A0A2M4D4T8_ANODA